METLILEEIKWFVPLEIDNFGAGVIQDQILRKIKKSKTNNICRNIALELVFALS